MIVLYLRTMNTINVSDLNPAVSAIVTPFLEDILRDSSWKIHSFHVIGSAVTPDFIAKKSDINSIVVLQEMDLKFVEFLAPLGKKYGGKGLSAPLIMTPAYIKSSLDAFPIEFLDFKLLHRTVHGEDILAGIEIDTVGLRLQCEREIKTKLIGLRQGYLSTFGKKAYLKVVLVKFITGSMPLFRAIISLFDHEPPIKRLDVINALGAAAEIDTDILKRLLNLRNEELKPSEEELHQLFEQAYLSIEAMGKKVDALRS